MARRPRRNHGAEFRAKAALAAIRGDTTLSEIAEQFEVHPHQVTEWKKQLLERAAAVFDGSRYKGAPPVDMKALHAKIEQLARLRLRLRFQPDARPAAGVGGERAPAAVGPDRTRSQRQPDRRARPLLRLHRRAGFVVRRRAA